jgi:MFS transporter, PAT family, beta-lactamase induction signal transducer AmpG
VTTGKKLLLLGSLYLAQGLPYGFFTTALPVLLREQGMSLPLIGLSQLLMLPWALKFVWAPLIDGVRTPRLGRRRAVIVPLQLASSAVLAALALAATPGAMWPLAIAVLLVNVCSATQDIATDGLAVEVLDLDERGLGNGLQVGGYRVGMIIGGGLMLVVFERAGWTAAFLAMSALLLATTVPIVVHREPPLPALAPRSALTTLGAALVRPGIRRWIAVLATFKVGEWAASAMLKPFLSDQRQSIGDIGVMLGFVGFGCALLGALIGGISTRGLGRRRALLVFGSLQTLAIASIALAVEYPSVPMFYAISCAEHVTSAMATTALFTAMMDFCRPDEAGTDYTVQASVVVIASSAASVLSGVSAKAIGYGPHFLLAAGLSLVGVLVVLAYRPSDPSFALVGSRR